MRSFASAVRAACALLLLAACGDSAGSASGSGGGGADPGSSSSVSSASASGSSGTGGADCSHQLSPDPACSACGRGSCCAEIAACYASGDERCFDDQGHLDPAVPEGGALIDCILGRCEAECTRVDGICESGVSYQRGDGSPDHELNACLGEACCAEYLGCTSSATDVQACLDCLESGGGPLCDGVLACEEDSRCFGFPVCESGVATQEEGLATCLADNCCDSFTTCTDGGADVQTCVDCLEGGGGPACDAAIACDVEFDCGLVEEG